MKFPVHLTAVLLVISAAAHAQTTAIVGARVHTVGPAGTIENATIVVENGTIRAVGSDVSAPAGARVINADGQVITPGLFTPFGQLGLVEVGFSAGPLDGMQRGEQFTAAFDVADAFNRRSTLIAINRADGVTRALVAPFGAGPDEAGNASHVISGLAAVAHLGDAGDGITRRGAAVVVSLGEGGSGLAGGSRTAALLALSNALDEALDYRDNKAAFELGQRRGYVHSVNDLEALQPVLSGDVPLLANVHRASDIEALLRLADRRSLRVIINGGSEAWMVASELAAADVPVIMGPTANLPGNFDRLNARRDAATVLVTAGVRVAFAGPQSQTHNARNITQSAGNAVSEGLQWDAALRAITLAPAEIFGVDESLGSIEVGKAADLVVWAGDPLELTSYPLHVFIDGAEVSMENRQTLLRDRRAVQVTVVLVAAKAIFQVPFVGSLPLLLAGVFIFIGSLVLIGYAISTVAGSQMQAMQMSFFIFLPSILLSGFMFPFKGMPGWAQVIGEAFPLTHFLRLVRGVMLKGADLEAVRSPMVALIFVHNCTGHFGLAPLPQDT